MMNAKDQAELDLFEARKAVAAARFSETKTDAVVNSAALATEGIRQIVSENGFLEKFRSIIGGEAA